MLNTLRATLCAGFVVTAAAASAQTLEIGIDQSPAGPRPAHRHRLLELHGGQRHDLRGPDRDRQGSAASCRGSPNPGPCRPTARPTPSSCARASRSTTARRWRPPTSSRRSAACSSKEIASPLASRLAAVDSATALDAQTVELKLKEPSAPLLVLARDDRHRAAARSRPTRTRLQKRAGRHRPVQVQGMAAERLHPARQARRLLEAGAAEARRRSSSTSCRNRRRGRSASPTASTPCCRISMRRRRCSSRASPDVKLPETLELAYTLVGMNVSKPPFDNAEGARGAELRAQPQRDRRRPRCSAPACRADRCRRR